MTLPLSVAIARLSAKYPFRSYQSICAELQQRAVASRRTKNKKRGRPAQNWAQKYDNY